MDADVEIAGAGGDEKEPTGRWYSRGGTDGNREAHLTVGACLVRALALAATLATLEVVWLDTGRGRLVAGLGGALGLLLAASAFAWPRWWWRALTGVRAALALIILILAGCVVGTLFVQDADLAGTGGEGARLAEFAARQGAFFWRLTHRTPRIELSGEEEAYFEGLAARFGRSHAREERRALERRIAAEVRGAASGVWVRQHRATLQALHAFLWATRLSNVFRSWWFAGLLAALGVNAAACSLRGLRGGWRRVGLAGIHLGVVLVLAGAAVGRLTRETGVLPVTVGVESDRYVRAPDGREIPLGFAVALHDCRTDYRKDLICSFPGPAGRHLARAYRAEPGTAIRLGPEAQGAPPRQGYSIAVEEFLPRAWPTGAVEEVPDPPRRPASRTRRHRPAVEVRIDEPGRPSAEHVLAGRADQYAVAEDNRYKIRFVFAQDRSAYEATVERDEREAFGLLTLGLASDPGARVDFLVEKAGQSGACSLGGRTYSVEVLEVWHDILAWLDSQPASRVGRRRPTSRPVPGRAAVRIRLTDPLGISAQRWIFEDERLQALHQPPLPDDVRAEFALDPWLTPTPQRYVIVGAPGEPLLLAAHVDGGRKPPLPLAEGEPVRVPGTETSVTLVRFIENALLPLAAGEAGEGGALAYFDRQAQPGVRLRIEGPAGMEVVWLRANTSGWYAVDVDGQLRIEYRDNRDAPPNDYRALLGVYDEGRLLREQVVEVNHPLRHGGYLFYQADPDHRHLMVVRDPSLPVVYAGLGLVCVGMAVHFLLIKAWTSLPARSAQAGRSAADGRSAGH